MYAKTRLYCCEDRHSIETNSKRCFISIVKKSEILLIQNFLMSKYSVNMRRTALFEMPTISASSRSFSRRSSNIILWIFCIIYSVVTSFGRPLRCSSWQTARPRLNCTTGYLCCCKRKSRNIQIRN